MPDRNGYIGRNLVTHQSQLQDKVILPVELPLILHLVLDIHQDTLIFTSMV